MYIVKKQRKVHYQKALAPQEQALLTIIRMKESLLKTLDSLRPRIIFPKSLEEYRRMIFGEVSVEEIAEALGGRNIRVVY